MYMQARSNGPALQALSMHTIEDGSIFSKAGDSFSATSALIERGAWTTVSVKASQVLIVRNITLDLL